MAVAAQEAVAAAHAQAQVIAEHAVMTNAISASIAAQSEPQIQAHTEFYAYWDHGECGVAGPDANWEWCGYMKFQCAEEVAVATTDCPSGKIKLVGTQGTG